MIKPKCAAQSLGSGLENKKYVPILVVSWTDYIEDSNIVSELYGCLFTKIVLTSVSLEKMKN